mmetsp:Transcript_55314/g.129032  ORF Transcript_55314/g.129032 Transcript_55314/m.129032 type:complete len:322 (+) Transcript_55314:647-1612(+)
MQPIGEVNVAVIEGDAEVGDEARHVRQGPALHGNRLHLDHGLRRPLPILAQREADHLRAECTASVALRLVRVMEEADFQRNGSDSQVQLLLQGAVCPVPDVELAAIKTFSHMRRVEALGEALGVAPLRRDHDVVSRLIPKVVAELGHLLTSLPAFLHLERLGVEGNEPSALCFEAILGGATAHEGHDDLIRSAVGRVWQSRPHLLQDLSTWDGLVELRRPWIRLHVDDVHVARQNARSHEVAMGGPSTLSAAAGACVPSKVVQFVPWLLHVQAVDHLAEAGAARVHVHGGDVIRLLALIHLNSRDVQQLLPDPRLHRLERR